VFSLSQNIKVGKGGKMMPASIVTALLWTAALSSGLIAGIYFAFSVFIMQAFGKIETSQSVAAMNAINETILRSLFMPLFFGSTIISVILIVVALVHWGDAGSGLTLIAGAIYFVGMSWTQWNHLRTVSSLVTCGLCIWILSAQ
jgi:uncharacterized membrane protein